MIKKFVLCFCFLFCFFSVFSFCFAAISVSEFSSPLTREQVLDLDIVKSWASTHSIGSNAVLCLYCPSKDLYYYVVFDCCSIDHEVHTDSSAKELTYLVDKDGVLATYGYSWALINSSFWRCDFADISSYSSYIAFSYNASNSSISTLVSKGYEYNFNRGNLFNFTTADKNRDFEIVYSDLDIYSYNSSDPVNPDNPGSLIFTGNGFSPSSNASFDYSFSGIDYRSCRLTVTGLDSSYRMYGYVDSCFDYSVGDTLSLNSNLDKIRLISVYRDNSDLYCNVYIGEFIQYFIVNADTNKIVKIGTFTELYDGDFLYGFQLKNREAIDFVFVRDGEIYWDNSLSFYYSKSTSDVDSFLKDNDVVSSNEYSFISNNKYFSSGSITGKVCDSSDNVLSSCVVNFTNDWSSPVSLNVDTSYYETSVGFNRGFFCINSLNLDGYDISGNSIDFSDYYVTWGIPSNVSVDSLTINNIDYSYRSGTFNGFDSLGLLTCDLQLSIIISAFKNQYKPFDFTFKVYDGSGNLVLTKIINSDNIISDEISSRGNNVDNDPFDIEDNPEYGGGSNPINSDFNDISNWKIEDYEKLVGTDNFIWQFFQAILGNLPWWIVTPLTILLFGSVIITLLRLIRGA